ncbi:MAG TPA: hypothetical protein VN174_04155 [Candidatus Methanoperedens sp.]|nr:hypothetical protein [Candidatus Methanoperedens sp.]
MRKIFLTTFLTLLCSFLFSANVMAQAKTKVAAITLPTFMAGENLIVDKPINGDLMISGGQIKIISDINGDTYVAGGQIDDISGTINGNLIVVGGNVTISGKVLKNVIVGGGQVKINNTADIGGYVLLGAGKADLLGTFSGPVKLGAGDLLVGEKAVLKGNLDADVTTSNISETSTIAGEKNIRIHETKKYDRPEMQPKPRFQLVGGGDIFTFFSKLVILLILVKLFGQKIIEVNSKKTFWSTLALGLVVLIVVPFLSLILFFTFVGIHLSWLIISLYFLALSLGGIVASILLGEYITKKGYLKSKNHYLQAFAGLSILTVVGLVPFAGALVKFVAFLFGLGAISWNLKALVSKK